MELSRYFRKQHEGERLRPPWMGASYYEFDRDVEVLHLVPFNFVISASREVYHYFRHRFYPLKWEAKLIENHMAGYKEGIVRGQEIREDVLERTFKEGVMEGARGAIEMKGLSNGN